MTAHLFLRDHNLHKYKKKKKRKIERRKNTFYNVIQSQNKTLQSLIEKKCFFHIIKEL